MREFLLTSKKFGGSLRFGYNEDVLCIFENQAQLDEEQLTFFERNFPFRLENLPKIQGTTGVIKEVTDLSFDAFWNSYDYKVKRPKAEEQWVKLNRNDKLAAICRIGYFKYHTKARKISLVYPERYLKDRRWEDEF